MLYILRSAKIQTTYNLQLSQSFELFRAFGGLLFAAVQGAVHPFVRTAHGKEVGGGGRNRDLGTVRRRGLEDFEEKDCGCLVVIRLHVL